jgi:hypothetical protein
MSNLLYYDDNLDVLRRHVDDETVDLVYLDPPFNSNASYNVLFAERDGSQADRAVREGGHVTVSQLRDLRGMIECEKAEIGVLLCIEEPTGPMRKEAANAGFYKSPWGQHPRLQILTVEDLLTGKTINRPPAQTSVTFKRPLKATAKGPEHKRLNFEGADEGEPA